jgi:creatinine amidohydrolase
MEHPEVRLERLRPDEVDGALARASIAWVPMGALEFHAPHLPIGTDGFTGHGVLVRAAEIAGGVVLPWSYLTLGTLRFPWSLRFERELVERALRDTLVQLADDGIRVLVVHTGHAPLDLIHLIKRVCAEVEASCEGVRAIGLCYLELNAALGVGLGTDWPATVDHAATLETSWVAALEPTLVDLGRLPDDPEATITGVYGPNPRFTADAERGARQITAASALLADRVTAALHGEPTDPLADLRTFVERYWPERLVLGGRAGARGEDEGAAALLVTNPAPVSRYLSGLSLRVDGSEVPRDGISLVNRTAGEAGEAVPAATLDAEHGFYVRRHQTAEVRLPDSVEPGAHAIELVLGLAGVTEAVYAETVTFE